MGAGDSALCSCLPGDSDPQHDDGLRRGPRQDRRRVPPPEQWAECDDIDGRSPAGRGGAAARRARGVPAAAGMRLDAVVDGAQPHTVPPAGARRSPGLPPERALGPALRGPDRGWTPSQAAASLAYQPGKRANGTTVSDGALISNSRTQNEWPISGRPPRRRGGQWEDGGDARWGAETELGPGHHQQRSGDEMVGLEQRCNRFQQALSSAQAELQRHQQLMDIQQRELEEVRRQKRQLEELLEAAAADARAGGAAEAQREYGYEVPNGAGRAGRRAPAPPAGRDSSASPPLAGHPGPHQRRSPHLAPQQRRPPRSPQQAPLSSGARTAVLPRSGYGAGPALHDEEEEGFAPPPPPAVHRPTAWRSGSGMGSSVVGSEPHTRLTGSEPHSRVERLTAPVTEQMETVDETNSSVSRATWQQQQQGWSSGGSDMVPGPYTDPGVRREGDRALLQALREQSALRRAVAPGSPHGSPTAFAAATAPHPPRHYGSQVSSGGMLREQQRLNDERFQQRLEDDDRLAEQEREAEEQMRQLRSRNPGRRGSHPPPGGERGRFSGSSAQTGRAAVAAARASRHTGDFYAGTSSSAEEPMPSVGSRAERSNRRPSPSMRVRMARERNTELDAELASTRASSDLIHKMLEDRRRAPPEPRARR